MMEIDPPIAQFTIFSGGGGLIAREGPVELTSGLNLLRVRGVPASFDPETFVVRVEGKGLEMAQVAVRKPSRQYVEDTLKREGACAQMLINTSVDLGRRRPGIIDTCEEVMLRTYRDEEVEIVLRVRAGKDAKGKVILSYFIDDPRFSWSPAVIVDVGDDDKVNVEGFITVKNESTHLFEDIEVAFADFAHSAKEDAYNQTLDNVQYQVARASKRMNMMMLK
jgi:hypothetical protein